MDRVRYQWILQQIRATRPTPSKKWYRESNGQLYWINTNGKQLKVIQEQEKDIILNGLHSNSLAGHFGKDNTYQRIKQKYYWPKMYLDIEEFVKTCEICQRRHGQHKQPSIQPIPVGQPFERIGIDLIGPLEITTARKRYIIVAIDYLTKWVEAKAITAKEADKIVQFIHEEITTRHGVPKEILSDNGLEFANKTMKDYCLQMGIIQQFASPYHPQTNGLVERMNRTLADTITKIANETGKVWDKCIPDTLFAIRTNYQSTTEQTPFYLTYGREAKTPIDQQFLLEENQYSTWENAELARTYQLQEELKPHRIIAQERIKMKQKEYKQRADDQNKHHLTFHIGDTVLIFRDYARNSFSTKLDDKWDEPYYIEDKIGETTYTIHDGLRKLKHPVHASRMKLYYPRKPLEF
jgi:transposase InsO family protein